MFRKKTILKPLLTAGLVWMAGLLNLQAQNNLVVTQSTPYALKNYTDIYTLSTFGESNTTISQIQAGTAPYNDKDVVMGISAYFDPSVNNCVSLSGNYLKVEVTVGILYTTLIGGVINTTTDQFTLTIDKHYTLAASSETERAVKTIANCYQLGALSISSVKATLLDGTILTNTQIPDNIYLQAELRRNRYYKPVAGSLGTTVYWGGTVPQWDTQCLNNMQVYNEFSVSWLPVSWASEYEIEWTYVDDYSASDLTAPQAASNLPLSFKNNSSRVRVPSSLTHYEIPLIYAGGWVCARVRAVTRGGANLDQDLFGTWSFDPNDLGTYKVSDLNQFARYRIGLHATTSLVNNANSQYGITFSEDGKILPQGSYADGSLRVRQNNLAALVDPFPSTRPESFTRKTGVVTETFYDFLGRPAVTSLPGVTEPGFWYKQKYNLSDTYTGDKFSYKDFDFGTAVSGVCYPPSNGMATTKGVSNYYSAANTNQTLHQSYLPDAMKFPFTRIVYEADNASRPKVQSGVGYDHRIGSGHETKYVYGNPSQEELNLLFGTDAGYAGYYQKSLIIDANGQTSITYTDLAGKTIATALSGKSPTALAPLKDASGNELEDGGLPITENLLGIVDAGQSPHGDQNLVSADSMGYTVNRHLLVSSQKDYLIQYTLQETDFQDNCVPNFCADCVYDLEIGLMDDCGYYIIGNASHTGPLKITLGGTVLDSGPVLDSICQTNTGYSLSQTVNLKPGIYNLVKKVRINQTALNHYVDYMMAHETCSPDISDFYNAPDLSDCFIDCSSCLTALGTETAFVTQYQSEYGSPEAARMAYRNLAAQCQSLCPESSSIDECALGYEMMLGDMSPKGQYGGYEAGSATGSELSIYNSLNVLPARDQDQFSNVLPGSVQGSSASVFGTGTAAYWRNPMYWNEVSQTWVKGYYDANGNRAIALLQPGGAGYLPAIVPGVSVQTDVNGQAYVYAEQLLNLQDFAEIFWQPSFAKSLVVYHPEYFKYEYCRHASELQLNVTDSAGSVVAVNTYQYGQVLSTLSFTEAASAANLNIPVAGTYCSADLIQKMLARDPYFAASQSAVSYADDNLFAPSAGYSTKDMFSDALYYYLLDPGTGISYDIVETAHLNLYQNVPATVCSSGTFAGVSIPASAMTDAMWQQTVYLYTSARQKAMGTAQDIFPAIHRKNIHSDCIGVQEYDLWTSPDAPQINSNPANLCNTEDYVLYAGAVQRFPSQESAAAQAGYELPPDLNQLNSYASQVTQLVTGKCPIRIDLENLLSKLAQNGKLSNLPQTVDVTNGYLGNTLYNYLGITGTINASIIQTGSGLELILPQGSGFNCTTAVAAPVFPAGYGWDNVYHAADLMPVSGGYSVNLFIDHPETTYVQATLTSCLPLNTCSTATTALCAPTALMKDIRALMNTLAANGVLWVGATLNGAYTGFITPEIKSHLDQGSGTTYYWEYLNPGSGQFNLKSQNGAGLRQITITITAGSTVSSGNSYVFNEIIPNPVTNATPTQTGTARIMAVLNTGAGTPYFTPAGTSTYYLDISLSGVNLLQSAYATECEAVTDPRCNTAEHRNRERLENKLRNALSAGLAVALGREGNCFTWPATFGNGTAFHFSSISSIDTVAADMSASSDGISSYTAKVSVTLGATHTYFILTYCQPLRSCEPCGDIVPPVGTRDQAFSAPEWQEPISLDPDIDCYEPVVPFPTDTIEDPCVAYLVELANENAYNDLQAYLDSLRSALRAAYIRKCMTLTETFTAAYTADEYHYTLYYYDRAGNLVRTVPPAAVKPLLAAQSAAVNTARLAGTRLAPDHNSGSNASSALATRYRYNALNQPIEQLSPDGGKSLFYYDNLGRVTFSQNAKQSAISARMFSYTRYDAQSRITEVGEMILAAGYTLPSRPVTHEKIYTDLIFNSGLSTYTKGQFVRTYYDVAAGTGFYPASFLTQNNLRKRVAYTTYEPGSGLVPASTSYQSATFYDYDYHGNVKTILSQNKDIPATDPNNFMFNFSYQRVDYRYDLVSGKVLEVMLNKGREDQYWYRYGYDDQNRLRTAQSSAEGYWYDTDAEYIYYLHGPLARVEYGQNNVQGADYAYTIHGWLKSLNSEKLDPTLDPGKDGYTGAFANTARDAYGFALSYYQGDYTRIGTGGNNFLLAVPGAYYGSNNLYNGNIVAMNNTLKIWNNTATVEPVLQVFGYDQLNRIAESHAYKQNGAVSSIAAWNAGAPAGNLYRTGYTYDANGNIKNLQRYHATAQIDNLTYNYIANKNQLSSVSETIGASTVAYDIDNQGAGNYTYDNIGNLLSDASEQIQEIKWNVYGKVTEVIRTSGSARPNLKFSYDAAGRRITKAAIWSGSTTYTFYTLDAQGNTLAMYSKTSLNSDLVLEENLLYGSSRVGLHRRDKKLSFVAQTPTPVQVTRGKKRYELSDHLGNVHTVVSDRKKTECSGNTFTAYEPEIINMYDYYPFGMLMEERKGQKAECGTTTSTVTKTPYSYAFPLNVEGFTAVGDANNTVSNVGAALRAARGGRTYATSWGTAHSGHYMVKGVPYTLSWKMMGLTFGGIQPAGSVSTVGKTIQVRIKTSGGSIVSTTNVSLTAGMVSGSVLFTPALTDNYILEFIYADVSCTNAAFDIDDVQISYSSQLTTVNCAGTGEKYLYGYNGKEKIDEQYGIEGTAYDFGARLYDSRLGRWMAVDPLAGKYPDLSPYQFVANSPLFFVDIAGEKIINADRIRKENAMKAKIAVERELADLEKQFGSLHKNKKFTGTNDDWELIKNKKDELKHRENEISYYTNREQSTDEAIEDFKMRSPNLFNKMDNMKNEYGEAVDAYFGTKNYVDMTDFANLGTLEGGSNEMPDFIEDGTGKIRPSTEEFGLNTVILRVEEDPIDRKYFEKQKGTNITNHEFGHFEILASQTAIYKKYYDELKKTGRPLNGGHNSDDPSGQKAEEYEKVEDIKP